VLPGDTTVRFSALDNAPHAPWRRLKFDEISAHRARGKRRLASVGAIEKVVPRDQPAAALAVIAEMVPDDGGDGDAGVPPGAGRPLRHRPQDRHLTPDQSEPARKSGCATL